MRSLILLGAVFCAIAPCQQPQTVASFSPQEKVIHGDTPWFISVCSPTAVQLPIGRLYGVLIQNHVTPLSFQSAYAALGTKPAKSVWGKVLMYASIGSSVAAAALATKVVSGNQDLLNAFTWASNGLTLTRTIATGQQPPVSPLLTLIPHDQDILAVPAGACGSTVLLGSYAPAFNAPVQ